MDVANEWSSAGNLKFDYLDNGKPRLCKDNSSANIKITFQPSSEYGPYWSVIGTESLDTYPSMNLGDFNQDPLPENVDDEGFRFIVLHEFGHALGLDHEHQSPNFPCRFNWKAVISYGAQLDWPEQYTKEQFEKLVSAPKDELDVTEYDQDSVMHYYLRPGLLDSKNGNPTDCGTKINAKLSLLDKSLMAKSYPKVLPPISSVNKVVMDYKNILEGANLDKKTVAAYTRKFKAAVTK
jgi:hypothetical protein